MQLRATATMIIARTAPPIDSTIMEPVVSLRLIATDSGALATLKPDELGGSGEGSGDDNDDKDDIRGSEDGCGDSKGNFSGCGDGMGDSTGTVTDITRGTALVIVIVTDIDSTERTRKICANFIADQCV